MGLPRLFLNSSFFPRQLEPTGDDLHYLLRVRRLSQGDRVQVILEHNGAVGNYLVLRSDTDSMELAFISTVQAPPKAAWRILLQPILVKNKLELVVQKCCELGIDSICLYQAQRGIVKAAAMDKDKQLRLAKTAREAQRQCGRGSAMEIFVYGDLFAAVESLKPGGLRLYMDKEGEDFSFAQTSQEQIAVCIGPEGGLSANELKILEQAAFMRVRLGDYTLRTETASLAAAVLCGLIVSRPKN